MPNLAEFGKNGRISNLPKPKPKFGATLKEMLRNQEAMSGKLA